MTTLNSASPAPGPAGSDLGAHSDSASLSLDTRIARAFNGAGSSEIPRSSSRRPPPSPLPPRTPSRRAGARSIRWLLPANWPPPALRWTMPNSCTNA